MDIETRPDDTKMKVAVCGWSYRMSAAHVAEEMRKIGVRTVDLAACPFVDPKAVLPNTGVELILETGQETADDLAGMLVNLPGVYVNLDPANMILYGKGDPVKAVKTLAPWIRHIHIKDANYAKVPGTWGEEVEWTRGQVNADAFIAALQEIGFDGCLAVEREAGNDRSGAIARAVMDLHRRGF